MKTLIPFLLVCSLCCATGAYADDEAALNRAMRTLNARAKTDADKKLVLSAVSQQTRVPEKTLDAQMRTSQLNYAELLTADSLATGGGKSLDNILALRARGKGWATISNELKIDPNSIVARLNNADKMVQAGQAKISQAGKPKGSRVSGFTDIRRVPGPALTGKRSEP